jgi:hypothetical protein
MKRFHRSKAKSVHHKTPKKAAEDTSKKRGLVEVGALVIASGITAVSQVFLLGTKVLLLPMRSLQLLAR